jgi:hypothetical protein
MRWFRIRTANIDGDLRTTFEQYGVVGMQVALSSEKNQIVHKRGWLKYEDFVQALLPWLTEQYDRAERKETWSITMEAAITFLVAIEAIPVLIQFIRWMRKF